jgi:glycosyltransferase involved in cell wall biosynthesis
MLRNRLYYTIKPLLPPSARLAVRRWFALRKCEEVRNIWPIAPGSENPPQGWPGWPEGKQFALVLTHDVEGSSGLSKVRKLMELEQKLGFRSSFNFIPEGGKYTTPKELRDELVRNGFEVGMHDLHHNGKLFLTKNEFSRNAVKINQYLKDWGATGFRSGFMLRNLDWIHELNVEYDTSTFDTDPFEPQPQGQNTIFPFWVPRPPEPTLHAPRSTLHASPSGGYVELPYTLPQDSTLFLLLRERHPDIWFQKLDWIARQGGLALVNVHPDYVRFDGEPSSSRTYPVEFYERFLEYVQQRYRGAYWHPLCFQLANFVAQFRPRPARTPLRVCMVTYSSYKSDARVTRYAESLAERGDHVDVLALSSSPANPPQEKVSNVNLFCIQSRRGKTEKSPTAFLFPVLRFLVTSSAWIVREHTRNPYDVFHIHNIPDFIVFAALWPKLRGAKVILDIHDIVPEFYGSKFNTHPGSLPIRFLKWIERASSRVADRVIIANHLWLEKYATRTGTNGKCTVFINNVDSSIFVPRPRTRKDGKQIIIFPGGLQWHQGLDIAIRAFQKVADELPNAEFHIYGDGNMKEQLVGLAQELGLNQRVRFFAPLSVRQIAEIMANADLGVVPKRADSFGNEAYSTKIMEFMSLGVPVVVSKTKIDQFYFNDSIVRFFESGNVEALAEAMLEMLRDSELRQRIIANASKYAAENSWESRKTDYLNLVDSLLDGRARSPSEPPHPEGVESSNEGQRPETDPSSLLK